MDLSIKMYSAEVEVRLLTWTFHVLFAYAESFFIADD